MGEHCIPVKDWMKPVASAGYGGYVAGAKHSSQPEA